MNLINSLMLLKEKIERVKSLGGQGGENEKIIFNYRFFS